MAGTMAYESDPRIRFFINSREESPVALIVHHVARHNEQKFLSAQRDVSELVATFPGYERTVVFPPNPGVHEEWIISVHFDTSANLDRWLESPERAAYLESHKPTIGEYELRKTSMGLDAWFASQDGQAPRPPAWKMVLTVVLVLFPTVMVLNLWVVGPWLQWMNFSERMLAGNFMSVAILQWIAMPLATAALAWWLKPTRDCGVGRTVAGVVLVAVVMAISLMIFSALAG